jgi:hypothetical protein
MTRYLRPVGLVLMMIVPVFGGQGPDLGKPVEAYEVEPGFVATVTRNARGEIREIVVERSNIAGSGKIDHGGSMPREVRDRIIDRLVPPGQRGEQIPGPWYGMSTMAGGMAATNLSFENVKVWEYSTYSADPCAGRTVLVITWPDATASASPSGQSN